MNKEAIKVKEAYEERDAIKKVEKQMDERDFKQKIIDEFHKWNADNNFISDYDILNNEYVLLEIFEYVEMATSLVSLDNSPPVTKIARFNIFKVLLDSEELKAGDLVSVMDDSLAVKLNEAFIIWEKTKDNSANKLKEPPPKYLDNSEKLDKYLFATNKFIGLEDRKIYLMPKNFIKARIRDGHIKNQVKGFI